MKVKGGRWILTMGLAVGGVLLLRGYICTSVWIPSSGMENTLYEGDYVLMDKVSYGLFKQPVAHNDIVVFRNPVSSLRLQAHLAPGGTCINRCTGLPGEVLRIDSLYNVLDVQTVNPDETKLYSYPQEHESRLQQILKQEEIKDNRLMGQGNDQHIRSFSRYEYYLLSQCLGEKNWIKPMQEQQSTTHLLTVPARGKTVRVYPWNVILLRNTLTIHEHKQAEVRGDSLFVNGKYTKHCQFSKDYYWMTADNSLNLVDSRLFGFVPADCIIGKARLVLFSKPSGRNLRKDRFFTSIH